MSSAGKLTERVAFQRRGLDANGDRLGAWAATAFSRWCEVTWLKGSEAVMQQRLQGLQPAILTVRDDSSTRTLDNSWRAVGASPRIEDLVFNIKGCAPARTPGFRDLTAVAGGPDA